MNPSKIPDELAGLTPEQLNTVHLWLDEHPYRVLVPKLKAELGVEITRSKLSRYSCSRDLADNIEDATGLIVQVQDLVDMYNGQPTRFDQASLILIQKRVFELAANSKTKPGLLKDLFRIATYADRKSWVDHRKEINTARLALDNRKQELREKQFDHQKSIDEKKFAEPEPPKKLTPQEKQEKLWDIFCLSEEERARRRAKAGWPSPSQTSTSDVAQANGQCGTHPASSAAVRPEPSTLDSAAGDFPLSVARAARTEGQGEGVLTSLPAHPCSESQSPSKIENQKQEIKDSSVQPPCPLCLSGEPHLDPANLAKHSDAYTVRRAEEYWAHRRTEDAWYQQQAKHRRRGGNPPGYETKLKECPCGCALPCPHHEEFLDLFWKVSPHDLFYAQSLQDRGIPYREP